MSVEKEEAVKAKNMIGAVRTVIICAFIVMFMIGTFFGAVLQESYRLCPVTAEEIAEVEGK